VIYDEDETFLAEKWMKDLVTKCVESIYKGRHKQRKRQRISEKLKPTGSSKNIACQ
jgi:hypothetical protein